MNEFNRDNNESFEVSMRIAGQVRIGSLEVLRDNKNNEIQVWALGPNGGLRGSYTLTVLEAESLVYFLQRLIGNDGYLKYNDSKHNHESDQAV